MLSRIPVATDSFFNFRSRAGCPVSSSCAFRTVFVLSRNPVATDSFFNFRSRTGRPVASSRAFRTVFVLSRIPVATDSFFNFRSRAGCPAPSCGALSTVASVSRGQQFHSRVFSFFCALVISSFCGAHLAFQFCRTPLFQFRMSTQPTIPRYKFIAYNSSPISRAEPQSYSGPCSIALPVSAAAPSVPVCARPSALPLGLRSAGTSSHSGPPSSSRFTQLAHLSAGVFPLAHSRKREIDGDFATAAGIVLWLQQRPSMCLTPRDPATSEVVYWDMFSAVIAKAGKRKNRQR